MVLIRPTFGNSQGILLFKYVFGEVDLNVDFSKLSLILEAEGMPKLVLPANLEGGEGEKVDVKIWRQNVTARTVSQEADEWVSNFLHANCRLVCTLSTQAHARALEEKYNPLEDSSKVNSAFSDGFPFLLATTASLRDLNTKLDKTKQVQMLQFRPNIVLSGTNLGPWLEDTWERISLGEQRNSALYVDVMGENKESKSALPAKKGARGLIFHLPKRCSRCLVPNVNPDTGEKPEKQYVTEVLRQTRERGTAGGVFFGQNVVQSLEAIGHYVEVGDSIRVLKINTKHNWP